MQRSDMIPSSSDRPSNLFHSCYSPLWSTHPHVPYILLSFYCNQIHSCCCYRDEWMALERICYLLIWLPHIPLLLLPRRMTTPTKNGMKVYVEGMYKINRFPNPIAHNKSVMQILITSSRTWVINTLQRTHIVVLVLGLLLDVATGAGWHLQPSVKAKKAFDIFL